MNIDIKAEKAKIKAKQKLEKKQARAEKLDKLHLKAIGKAIVVFTLILSGIAGTLGYQRVIAKIEQGGIDRYKSTQCTSHAFEDGSATWLECEPKRLNNNQ